MSFENNNDGRVHTGYYLPKVKGKYYNLVIDMIDRKNIFDQPGKSDIITYIYIHKIVTGEGDDYTTGCLLNYNYFNKHYKMIAIDLSKQQVPDADPKAIQQINFFHY